MSKRGVLSSELQDVRLSLKGGYCVIVNSPLALRILDKGQLKEKKMKG
tara:strand:+ start:910 stop:1053 length:144 start_codon:yes stop_codon:yes gene_type:complete